MIDESEIPHYQVTMTLPNVALNLPNWVNDSELPSIVNFIFGLFWKNYPQFETLNLDVLTNGGYFLTLIWEDMIEHFLISEKES